MPAEEIIDELDLETEEGEAAMASILEKVREISGQAEVVEEDDEPVEEEDDEPVEEEETVVEEVTDEVADDESVETDEATIEVADEEEDIE